MTDVAPPSNVGAVDGSSSGGGGGGAAAVAAAAAAEELVMVIMRMVVAAVAVNQVKLQVQLNYHPHTIIIHGEKVVVSL